MCAMNLCSLAATEVLFISLLKVFQGEPRGFADGADVCCQIYMIVLLATASPPSIKNMFFPWLLLLACSANHHFSVLVQYGEKVVFVISVKHSILKVRHCPVRNDIYQEWNRSDHLYQDDRRFTIIAQLAFLHFHSTQHRFCFGVKNRESYITDLRKLSNALEIQPRTEIMSNC